MTKWKKTKRDLKAYKERYRLPDTSGIVNNHKKLHT